MTIGNHKYEIQNRLKINLFTTTPGGVNYIEPSPRLGSICIPLKLGNKGNKNFQIFVYIF
jgi:hypothetical protein